MKPTSRSARYSLVVATCLTLIPLSESLQAAQDLKSSTTDPAYRVAQASNTRKRTRTREEVVEDPRVGLENSTREVGRLEDRFGKLKADYGNPTLALPADEIRRQYEEATYLYLIEDYQQAALLFYAVLDQSTRDTFKEYEDAEYFLAESLSLGKNLYPALEYFTRIVAYGPAHRYYESGVVNMLELYAKTGNFEKFSSSYGSYIERSQGLAPTEAILYALGKTFYAQKNYARALEIFSQLNNASGNFPYLARYYCGTIHVVLLDYDKALEQFNELLKLSVNTPEQREVEDLAYLALGRIYFERKEYAKAYEQYANISRDSAHFAEALYEMSWTQIKKGDFEQAIRTIDILLLTYPDDASSPRLKLVRGILQQRRKSYDDALDTYQKLVAEYAGIKEELDRIMDHPKDILSYFNDLVDTDLNRMESAFLVPALAVRFALADPNMSRVLELNRDVVTQRTDLENASRLLHDIEQELDNNPPHNLLVGMRRARGGINTLENNVLLARERVLQNEYAYLIQLGDPAVTAKAEAWMREQEEQGRLNRQMPEVQRELSELVDVYEDQLKEVQKNGFKLESQIEDLMAQAAAIEKYISYGRESGAMTAEMEQSTRGKLQEIVGELEEDLRELAGIQEEIKDLDVRRKLKDAFDAEEAAYRRQAAARQEKARENLLAIRSMARGENSFFRESDALYDRLDGLSGDLNQFYRDLDGIEMQQIAVVRQNIEREKSALFEQGTLAQQYTEEVGGLSEEIAVSAFGNIHQQFSDLILKADFGITDVYWELKEDKTGEIELNQSQRADELGALREKFKELQSGDL